MVALRDQHSGNPHGGGMGKVEKVIKEKRRLWKEWKNGSSSKERYIESKRVAWRQVYEVKSKAVTEQFGNLSTSKNC